MMPTWKPHRKGDFAGYEYPTGEPMYYLRSSPPSYGRDAEGGEIRGPKGSEDSVPVYLSPGYHSPDHGKTWYVTEPKYPESWMQQAQYYQQAFDQEATCMAGYMFHQHLLKPSRWRRFKNWLFRR